jgi:hypothetical protein
LAAPGFAIRKERWTGLRKRIGAIQPSAGGMEPPYTIELSKILLPILLPNPEIHGRAGCDKLFPGDPEMSNQINQ